MTGPQFSDSDDHLSRTERSPAGAWNAQFSCEPASQIEYSQLLLPGRRDLAGPVRRGSAGLHAQAIQRAQQTYGNRAVSRYVQRTGMQGAANVAVQRDILGSIGSGLSSAWDWMKGTAQSAWNSLTSNPAKSFEELSGGDMKSGKIPEKIQLPKELTEGMQKSWEGSLPGGKAQEQGGILVKDAQGKYDWKAGPGGGEGSFMPNYGDVKKGETFIGTGHTHPYAKDEGGHTNVTFSGGDLGSFATDPDKFQVVQSGKGQFVTARTEEFNKRLEGLDKKGKQELRQKIEDEWDKIYTGTKGSLPERAEAATKAISAKYNIAYYEGQEGTLTRQ